MASHKNPCRIHNALQPPVGMILRCTDFGVAVVGDIDLELVGKLKVQLESPDIKQRHHRQTEIRTFVFFI